MKYFTIAIHKNQAAFWCLLQSIFLIVYRGQREINYFYAGPTSYQELSHIESS